MCSAGGPCSLFGEMGGSLGAVLVNVSITKGHYDQAGLRPALFKPHLDMSAPAVLEIKCETTASLLDSGVSVTVRPDTSGCRGTLRGDQFGSWGLVRFQQRSGCI